MIHRYGTEDGSVELDEFIRKLRTMQRRRALPFNETTLALLADFSGRLLKSGMGGAAPQVVTLAFWLRKAALFRLEQSFRSSVPEGNLPVARGLAFHLPPTNVDTLFVYSCALSMLAGNANVVRLPNEIGEVTHMLLDIMLNVLADHGEADRHIFCKYSEFDGPNAAISAASDARIIWGGDAKVSAVSRYPVRVDGISIGFPHRTSLTLLKTDFYAGLEDAARSEYVKKMYNDIFWFDQMGCGSPRTLIWVGDEPGALAIDLYRRLDKEALDRGYAVDTSTVVAKMGHANYMVSEGDAETLTRISNRLFVVDVDSNRAKLSEDQGGGGGFLRSLWARELAQIGPELNEKTQTLTYRGFSDQDLNEIARIMAKNGGFRLVPVGQALAFDETWDGLSLLSALTRQVAVMREL